MTDVSKVLIVEDEAIIARDIQMQLTSAGFTVTGTARTASDAFQHIEDHAPDLILMDIRIKGGMDGVETAHIVRERYALPVIYLTAHADDATLERAQLTEPFGYIVKPLGNANIKAVITMALHKHRMERELDNHRKLLSTILQGLPDAVLVVSPSGEILFLNRTAERLLSVDGPAIAGKNLVDVLRVEDQAGRPIASQLLNTALSQAGTVVIPRDTLLVTVAGTSIPVTGQLAVAAFGTRAAGVFITLQDVTVQKAEEQRLRQEQQLFTAGELARGVATEFYSLFDLMEDCASELADAGQTTETDLLVKSGQIGKSMALQLLDFREAHGPAHAINVNQHFGEAEQLLQRFCGRNITFGLSCAEDAGFVLTTGRHFEQLLMHMLLEGKSRIEGEGNITITADNHVQAGDQTRTRSYVRLSMRAEGVAPQHDARLSAEPFPLNSTQPDLSLTLVRALTSAAGGTAQLSCGEPGAVVLEILLPRYNSQHEAAASVSVHQNIVLAVGLSPRLIDAVQQGAGHRCLVMDAALTNEASLIAELFPGRIDLVIINDLQGATSAAGERATDRIRARRADAGFLTLSQISSGAGNQSIDPSDLESSVAEFFSPNQRRSLPQPV